MGITQTSFSSEEVKKWQGKVTFIQTILGISTIILASILSIIKLYGNKIELTNPLVILIILIFGIFMIIQFFYGDLLYSN